MPVVVPLQLMRPLKEYAERVAARPYDVVSYEEALSIAELNPMSFLRVEKSEIDFPSHTPSNSDEVFQKAAINLKKMVEEGIFRREQKPCFYIYRQKVGNHEQYGIVGGIRAGDYEAGSLKRHELTFANKEDERTRHVSKVNAQTGPVFVTYRARKMIDDTVRSLTSVEPEYEFTADDGVLHAVWVVSEKDRIDALMAEFALCEALYIADGHHRAAAAAAVAGMKRESNPRHRGDENYNYIMSVLFPHDQIRILDYNRVVKDLNGLNEKDFLKKLSQVFDVNTDYREKSPGSPQVFGMYLQGCWYELSFKRNQPDGADAISSLDVSILQERLLGPVLGILDPRTDSRIDFVGGVRGMAELERLVDSGRFAVAFALHPTTLGQLMAVADAGKIMPPKSTWFEPKLRSGLFVHLLD